MPKAFAIRVTPQYLDGTLNAPAPGWAEDPKTGERQLWATREEAEAEMKTIVDDLYSSPYHLQHGEHARPEFEVFEAGAP